MSAIAADDEGATYLAKALFLAETMAAPSTSLLLTAKRERVFEQMSHSRSEHADADFRGMRLWLAISAVASWNGSLPSRHRFSATVLGDAVRDVKAALGRRTSANEILAGFLRELSGHRDPFVTERSLRDALARARSTTNRERRRV